MPLLLFYANSELIFLGIFRHTCNAWQAVPSYRYDRFDPAAFVVDVAPLRLVLKGTRTQGRNLH